MISKKNPVWLLTVFLTSLILIKYRPLQHTAPVSFHSSHQSESGHINVSSIMSEVAETSEPKYIFNPQEDLKINVFLGCPGFWQQRVYKNLTAAVTSTSGWTWSVHWILKTQLWLSSSWSFENLLFLTRQEDGAPEEQGVNIHRLNYYGLECIQVDYRTFVLWSLFRNVQKNPSLWVELNS